MVEGFSPMWSLILMYDENWYIFLVQKSRPSFIVLAAIRCYCAVRVITWKQLTLQEKILHIVECPEILTWDGLPWGGWIASSYSYSWITLRAYGVMRFGSWEIVFLKVSSVIVSAAIKSLHDAFGAQPGAHYCHSGVNNATFFLWWTKSFLQSPKMAKKTSTLIEAAWKNTQEKGGDVNKMKCMGAKNGFLFSLKAVAMPFQLMASIGVSWINVIQEKTAYHLG